MLYCYLVSLELRSFDSSWVYVKQINCTCDPIPEMLELVPSKCAVWVIDLKTATVKPVLKDTLLIKKCKIHYFNLLPHKDLIPLNRRVVQFGFYFTCVCELELLNTTTTASLQDEASVSNFRHIVILMQLEFFRLFLRLNIW